MSALDLLLLYAVVGAGCAIVVHRRTRGSWAQRLGASALAFPLWPIWAPIALLPDRVAAGARGDRAERMREELRHAVDAARGSPFEILFSREAADQIEREIADALARISELDALLAQPDLDLERASERVDALTRSGNTRALKTAVLHRDNVARITALRDRHGRALEELGELIGALRSQLVLARYAGSSPEGVGGIVTELWARVEGLGEIVDAQEPRESA